jgi:hypothetical protein
MLSVHHAGHLSRGIPKQVRDDFSFSTCHPEVRRIYELCMIDRKVRKCFVPTHDMLWNPRLTKFLKLRKSFAGLSFPFRISRNFTTQHDKSLKDVNLSFSVSPNFTTLHICYRSSFAILVGVSLPATILRELSAIALMVEVILLTSNELNSSFTV